MSLKKIVPIFIVRNRQSVIRKWQKFNIKWERQLPCWILEMYEKGCTCLWLSSEGEGKPSRESRWKYNCNGQVSSRALWATETFKINRSRGAKTWTIFFSWQDNKGVVLGDQIKRDDLDCGLKDIIWYWDHYQQYQQRYIHL